MEIPQLYKVVHRYPIWENANLDYIYYPRFSINLIVIRIECTLENLEIFFRTLRSTNTFQNCDIYEGRIDTETFIRAILCI